MSRKIIPILVIVLLLLTVSCSRSLTGKSGTVVPVATDYIKLTVDAMRPPTITPSPTHDIALGTMTPIPPTPTSRRPQPRRKTRIVFMISKLRTLQSKTARC